MKVTADQEGHRCTKCGEYIKVGQEIVWSPAIPHLKVATDRHHVSCPEKKKKATAGYVPRPQQDAEEMFHYRKCSREGAKWDPNVKWERSHMNVCGKYLTIPRSERAPRECPYCGAGLLRPHPSEPGWVAA